MSIQFTGQLPLTPLPVTQRNKSSYDASLRVTALGGGHGLSATLSALRLIAGDITAIVTVADDGGSSGTIRKEMDVLPPGDLRMALAALCDDSDWGRTWRDTIQHRFTSLPDTDATLNNHALGNLLIVALWELLDDPVDGLRWVAALLGARGTVLPMSTVPLTISGTVLCDENDQLVSKTITGQVALATEAGRGRVSHIKLTPEDAPATPEALDAIDLADWVVLGPGSWYTSVLPHLLLPEARQALAATDARRLLVMNLQPNTSETNGMSATDHLNVLAAYAPDVAIDVIIADPATVSEHNQFIETARGMGAEVVFSRVSHEKKPTTHDPLRLAVAFNEAFNRFR